VPQGNSLCSYLKKNKNGIFFFYKIGEQKGGIGPALGGVVPVGGKKGRRRWERV
jgi:hypothetical protein